MSTRKCITEAAHGTRAACWQWLDRRPLSPAFPVSFSHKRLMASHGWRCATAAPWWSLHWISSSPPCSSFSSTTESGPHVLQPIPRTLPQPSFEPLPPQIWSPITAWTAAPSTWLSGGRYSMWRQDGISTGQEAPTRTSPVGTPVEGWPVAALMSRCWPKICTVL